MKNVTFSKKLLLFVLLVLFTSLGINVTLTAIKSFDSSKKASSNYIKEVTQKNALLIQESLNDSLGISKQLTTAIISMKENNLQNKDVIISMMSNITLNNTFIKGVFIDIDSNKLFPNDTSLKDLSTHDDIGRFAPYVIRTKDTIDIEPLPVETTKDRRWYTQTKLHGKEFILEPYFYEIEGKKELITALVVPVYEKGTFIGVIGIDLLFESINQRIDNLKLYETGYAFLTTSSGKIIAHKKRQVIGKNIAELTKDKKLLAIIESVKKGKDYETDASFAKKGVLNHYYINSFEVGKSGINWGYGVSVPIDEYIATAKEIRFFNILAGLATLILVSLVIFFFSKKLEKNLRNITTGLNSFFDFLNRKTTSSQHIQISSNDEFGQMAQTINNNVDQVEQALKEDNDIIHEVQLIVQNVKEGTLSKRIHKQTNNPSLTELKIAFNEMLDVLMNDISSDTKKLTLALEKFSFLDFTKRVDDDGQTAQGLNNLAMTITEMLIENKSNGLTLQNSSEVLMNNVTILNNSSNQAAASLEETAAAIEQIAANINSNNENVIKMAQYAQELKKSASSGNALANDTTIAMEKIDEEVNAISEAISIIDQIAFQTNILSLNAAVEAATAGEAGKGFAVVAQEVRNLASRSAEAASEIKILVESATSKANDGKEIANKMIEGYSSLNENVTETLALISNVEIASKEQQSGIEQITNVVNELDKQTQENAAVANNTQTIAMQTLTISETIVNNANQKEFIGKDQVKAKILDE